MWKSNKKVYRPKSIQNLLLHRLFFILIIILIVLGIYQYINMKAYLIESKIELLDSRFKNLEKDVVLATNTNEMLIRNTDYILNVVSGEDICVAIINRDCEIIDETNIYNGIKTDINKSINKTLAVPKLSKEIYFKDINDNKVSSDYYIVRDEDSKKQLVILREIGTYNNPAGLVQISTTVEDIEEFLYEQVRVYIFSMLIGLLLISMLGKIVLKHTLKPLKKLTYQLDNVDENQLNTRIDINNGQIEIDILANKFNKMFQRLEKSFEEEKKNNIAMKNFILDVSHELRTPLTSIQGFIEVLQLGAFKDENKLQIGLNSMMAESRRLSKLVNELLFLVKLEGNISVELKKENINDIINEVKSQLEILKGDRKLEFKLNRDMYCMVNKDQIKQVIYNLFQNAINHTDDIKGVINISTKSIKKDDNSWIEVSIKDNGEGIDKENIKLIFDRFYRADKHRARKNGGYGLGLSIVQRIIHNHNGEINVESIKGKGSTFSFLFKEIK